MHKGLTVNTLDEFNRLIIDNDYYAFTDCIFNTNIILRSHAVNLAFNNCVFNREVNIHVYLKGDVTFAGSVFNREFSIENMNFRGNVRFNGATFNSYTNFKNTVFENLADFWGVTFEKETIFYKTDFMGKVVFSAARFKKNALFSYTLFDSFVILRDTIFEKGLDLSLSILIGRTSIYNISLNDFDTVNDTDDITQFDEYVSKSGEITLKNKRETFRIIKNQLSLCQNSIDSLKFYELELNAYHEELKKEIFPNDIIFRSLKSQYNILKRTLSLIINKLFYILKLMFIVNWIRKIRKQPITSYIVLSLNHISNKNGTSWWQGVKFTFHIGLFLFYFSILATERYIFSFKIDLQTLQSLTKPFFSFLLPIHDINYLKEFKPNDLFYFFDFIGRIFVSYGIFQTVQAFRKFKTK